MAAITQTRATPVRRSRRRPRTSRLANVLAVLIAVAMAFPVYWMFVTAFKPGKDILTLDPQFLPLNPTLSNFSDAVSRPFFWSSVRNAVIVTLATVVISIGVAFLAAVAVARMRFRGRTAFLVMVLMVLMVPLNALIIPLFVMLNRIGQVDKLSGVVLTYLAFVLPFAVWTLRGFVQGVPRELEEAAMVDGCTRAQAFRRVVFPLVAPGLVATSVFAFIQAWNEFILAYVLLQSQENQTITVWLSYFTTQKGTEWGPLMAASILTSLPVVVFFLIVQNRMASGLTAGAVKG